MTDRLRSTSAGSVARPTKSGVQIIRQRAGRQVSLPRDTWDIIDRIQRGDGTCGWSGDPRMFVVFDELTQKYQVRRLGTDGREYLCFSYYPEQFDARVLMDLARGDTWARGRDPIAEVDAHNDAIERDAEREAEAMEEEMRDIAKYLHNKIG